MKSKRWREAWERALMLAEARNYTELDNGDWYLDQCLSAIGGCVCGAIAASLALDGAPIEELP